MSCLHHCLCRQRCISLRQYLQFFVNTRCKVHRHLLQSVLVLHFTVTAYVVVPLVTLFRFMCKVWHSYKSVDAVIQLVGCQEWRQALKNIQSIKICVTCVKLSILLIKIFIHRLLLLQLGYRWQISIDSCLQPHRAVSMLWSEDVCAPCGLGGGVE